MTNINQTDTIESITTISVKSRIINFLTSNWLIISILILATTLRLIHLQHNYAIWWDSSVYLGVAKYIYSAGASGMWEPYRPLIHPLILGFFWKLGANIVTIGKLLDLFFSFTAISLTYLIAKQLYSKTAGYYAALILAVEPLFIMFTGLILTEGLALTISLLAIYFFINRNKFFRSWQNRSKYLLIGALFALAALTKFPLGIIFIAALLARQLAAKFQGKTTFDLKNRMLHLQESIWYCMGFALCFLPYLILNYILYKDPLLPFTSGSWIISTFLWQYNTNFWFYFTNFFQIHELFAILAIAIPFFLINKDYKEEGKLTIFLSAMLLFLYFWLQVPRKEVRYMIIMYPFFVILMGSIIANLHQGCIQTLNRISNKISNKVNWEKIVSIIITIIFVAAIFGAQSGPAFYLNPTYSEYQYSLEKLGNYIQKNNFDGTILISSPFIGEHVDNYLFPTAGIDLAQAVYDEQLGNFDYLFLRDCDYVCQTNDLECEKAKTSFLQKVDQEQILLYLDEYETNTQTCNLYFYVVDKTLNSS